MEETLCNFLFKFCEIWKFWVLWALGYEWREPKKRVMPPVPNLFLRSEFLTNGSFTNSRGPGASGSGERQVLRGLRSHPVSPPSFNSWCTGSFWATVPCLLIPGFETFISSSAGMELESWLVGAFALGPLALCRPVSGENCAPHHPHHEPG